MQYTVAQVQEKLASLKLYAGDIDGLGGPLTAEAVGKFQEIKQLPVTGKLDPATLDYLFPAAVSAAPKTIKGTITDYVLNLVKSKTAWAATALTALIVGWVQTKFGFQVPPELQTAITTVLSLAGGGLILVLQTAFNSPHMTTKQPAVVQKPAEFK